VLSAVLLAIADGVHQDILSSGNAAIIFPGQSVPAFNDYLYFSFVTLTTLGYGDVTPVSHLARSMAILIAVTGQLYMTILIAMLVGKFLARSEGK
jgi:voltage-gated potassium channel